MQFQIKNKKKGISLIEIVIASSIISVVLVSIVAVFSNLQKLAIRNVRALQATELAEEGVEALKFMRDSSWTTNFPTLTYNQANPNHIYNLNWDGAKWSTTTSATIGRFERTFVFSTVCRDGSNNVATCPASSSDAGSMKAIVTVSWTESGATKIRSIEAYIFDLFNN